MNNPLAIGMLCDAHEARREERRRQVREACETVGAAVLGVSAAMLLIAAGCVLAQWVMGGC